MAKEKVEKHLGHRFRHVWRGDPRYGRECIALKCRRCGLKVDDPRWYRNQAGEDVCTTLRHAVPLTCDEQICQDVHES